MKTLNKILIGAGILGILNFVNSLDRVHNIYQDKVQKYFCSSLEELKKIKPLEFTNKEDYQNKIRKEESECIEYKQLEEKLDLNFYGAILGASLLGIGLYNPKKEKHIQNMSKK